MIAATPAAVSAQTQPPPAAPVAAAEAAEASATPWFDLRGRLLAHARLAQHDGQQPGENLDLLVHSARLGARAHISEALRLELQLELTDKPQMKDGFAQYETKRLLVRVGQFKMPSLVITRTSSWALPLARRGTINTLLTDFLLLAGRRPGLLLEWRGGGALDPTLSLGAFQGSTWTIVEGERPDRVLITERGLSGQKPIVRLGVSPAGVEIGAFAEWRPFPVGGGALARQWTAGVDVVVDEKFEGHAMRAWFEGTAGRSWADANWLDDDLTTFAAARALVAWRRGGRSRGERYLEGYGSFNVLEPDTEVASDFMWEAMAGVNVGLWKRARLGIELSTFEAGAQAPPFSTWVKRGQPSPVRSHKTGILQAGLAF